MNAAELVEQDFVDELAAHVAGIAKLYQARLAKADATRFEEPLTEAMKQWMVLNLDRLDRDAKHNPVLVDGEHGLQATLRSRKATEWDVKHMPRPVLDWLLEHSLLTVNTAAFEKLRPTVTAKEYDEAKGYQLEGATLALYVEPVK